MSNTVGAVFLDRDGVINENRANHVKTWSEFSFIPGAVEAIVALSQAGVPVFVVSNQAVIGRGIVRSRAVEAINRRMVHEAANAGGRIVDVAYCPHRPEDRCSCRKPQPGLILGLATAYGVDLAKSVVIGDALTDVEAGRAAGCESILVLTGRGSDEAAGAAAVGPVGFSVAASLSHAVQAVLERSAVASRAEVESL